METEIDSMALRPAPSRSPVADERARLTEAEFSALLDAAVDGIVIMDAEGRIEGLNASAERLFGFSPEEVMGRKVGMLMSESRQGEKQVPLVPEPAAGRPQLAGSRELVAHRRDGSTFPVELALGEVRSQVPRFVGIIRDISERKKIERRLTQREHELRLTIENAPIPICTVGLDGTVLSANLSFCKMLGYTQREIVRMTFRDFTFREDLPLTVSLMDEALRGEGDTYTYQKRYVHKDGRVVHVVLHNGVVRGDQGRPEMFVVQVEDLTERMKAEEDAREHRERLAHVDRLNVMGEMAASIAHEINQPLSAIANYTNAAYRRVSAGQLDGEKLSSSLMKIDEQAQRAGEVVRRLRNLVKKRESQRELLDINELVCDSLRLAEIDARIHDVVVETSFTECPSRVLADPVSNRTGDSQPAAQCDRRDGHGGQGRESSDGPHRRARQLRGGFGLRPGHRHHQGARAAPFRTFLHHEGGRYGHGTVHKPLDRQRPRWAFLVHAQSRPGSDFPLLLAKGDGVAPMNDSAPTIFVVDDDDAVRDSLSDLIDSVGLEVATYPSAHDFLADYDNARRGCLVLDIRMPGMSGLELQERLNERGSTLPVVFITGHGDVPMAVEAMKRGAVDFIQKPSGTRSFSIG